MPSAGSVVSRILSAIKSPGNSCGAWTSLNHRPITATNNTGNGTQAERCGPNRCDRSIPGLTMFGSL